MSANFDRMNELLRPYGPQRPLADLVVELNRLYHDVEADEYDASHPEVHQQLPAIWVEMVHHLARNGAGGPWRVLDFGCGTGFEALQLLRTLPQGAIADLTCFDPSPRMLDRCRASVSRVFPGACFVSHEADLENRSYDLLVTNSVLHHLPAPVETVRTLTTLLAPRAVWLAGHEPSNRFYRNPVCRQYYEEYLNELRWRKYMAPGKYLHRLRVQFGHRSDPARQAAAAAVQLGLFQQPPPSRLIGLLVDFSVAHSFEEARSDRGFDFKTMQCELDGDWELDWVKTYSHMGPVYEGQLSRRWERISRELSARHPLDGANFSTVWRRSP
jgi:SAM-dependent methyltransferase